jgi:hypothetical protein
MCGLGHGYLPVTRGLNPSGPDALEAAARALAVRALAVRAPRHETSRVESPS